MTPPKALTYSSARRMTRGSATHLPSSEKTRTRARDRCMRPSSASSSPARPLVTAPTGCTSTRPAATPRSWTRSAASAVSVTGLVLAIAKTAVNPPTAAAREPVTTVSASSRPGSRRGVCRSTRPGRATSPSASTTSAPVLSTDPISVIAPSTTSRSPVVSPRSEAPRTTSFVGVALTRRSLPLRAGGRGWPSGPRHRRRPGRGSPTARRPRRRLRSPGRGSSDRGGRSGRRGPAGRAGRG